MRLAKHPGILRGKVQQRLGTLGIGDHQVPLAGPGFQRAIDRAAADTFWEFEL